MKTFENQSKLPKLPVPSLDSTLAKYLDSVRAVCNSQEFKEYSKIVDDFRSTDGPKLQSRLLEHSKAQKYSWLEDWWLKLAYLSWRESVLVHSNWYVLPTNYFYTPTNIQNGIRTGITDFQILRASWYTSNFLDYKQSIDDETLAPETTKSGPLCMDQYKRMFGVTRIPRQDCDESVQFDDSEHIILMVMDQIFVVYVYDDEKKRIRISQIVKLFTKCVESIKYNFEAPVGILSGQHRDDWARDYKLLEKDNKNVLKWISSALFCVCLDHKPIDKSTSGHARNVFHGYDGHNRWFDKSLSIVAFNDGRVGVHGEHSPCDALVPAYLVDFCASREPAKDPVCGSGKIKDPFKLTWTLNQEIHARFPIAQEFINKTISDSDLEVYHFTGYGDEFIKKVVKTSPDAFMQMALQVVFYRIHGYFAAVYETASTRQYLHGRTETCRSLSVESKDFILALENPTVSISKKYELLLKACKKHSEYIKAASQGYGVDRHLLGLRLVNQNQKLHEIFTHKLFAKSSKWQLSTSALFSGDRMVGSGFGTVYHDGYGMNYMISKNKIKIGVESKFSDPFTSTRLFCQHLKMVLCDLKILCQEQNNAKL